MGDEPVKVAMTCDHAPEPGRVRCAVDARAPAGLAIRWGDVEIVRTPDFVSPLKGRIGPLDATAKEDLAWRWALALVARRAGQGEVVARVRLVVCDAEKRCSPRSIEARTMVAVGPVGSTD